jgi:hypothetical protein
MLKKYEDEIVMTDGTAVAESLVLPDILTKVTTDPQVLTNANRRSNNPNAGQYSVSYYKE